MLLFHIFFFHLNHLPLIYLCMCTFLEGHPYIRKYVRECVCDRQNYMYVFWVTHTHKHPYLYTPT